MSDLRLVFACDHVVAGAPLGFARREEPLDAHDTGWQFFCGSSEDCRPMALELEDVIARDPTVRELLELPEGTEAERATYGWRVTGP